MDDIPRTFWYRVLEIFPGATSWIILIVPVVAAFWFPRLVSIFIIIYVIWWFLRSLKSSVFLILSFFKSKRFEKINWRRLLTFFSENSPEPRNKMDRQTLQRIKILRKKGLFKKWTDIYHVIIIATYKEEKEILESTIETLTQMDFPLDKIILVLATEERDKNRALANTSYLSKRFVGKFGQFHHFMHPANIPGEIAGKGGNITYAGKQIAAILQKQNIEFSNVLVTTLDADNRPHRSYFSNLTYHYLIEEKRNKKSYQPLPFFYSNIWDVPFVNRLIALANTFWYLAESGESYHLRNASAHAQSLNTLVAIDFWSRQTITEDHHQFWRAYFYFNGDHEVIPLFVAVYQDALQNKTYFTSLVGQYRQLRRWAWACSDIPYVAIKMWKQRKVLPAFKSLSALTYLCYGQIMWATAPVILLLNKSIPTILNPNFSNTLFAYNLGQILHVLLTSMLVGIIISLWISLLSLPFPKGKYATWKFIFSLFHWLLLPFVTIVYGAIPAIEAQTRLILNKPLGFMVTEKTRKIRACAHS